MKECDHIVGFDIHYHESEVRKSLHDYCLKANGSCDYIYDCKFCPECGSKLDE